ncbi:hypothetical protein EDC94DRAFT_590110 [Helicostylum pulchrum]|nr:hypothetical protein EDC94DRAFT_590110 [Helicostylum pulchrum]
MVKNHKQNSRIYVFMKIEALSVSGKMLVPNELGVQKVSSTRINKHGFYFCSKQFFFRNLYYVLEIFFYYIDFRTTCTKYLLKSQSSVSLPILLRHPSLMFL